MVDVTRAVVSVTKGVGLPALYYGGEVVLILVDQNINRHISSENKKTRNG